MSSGICERGFSAIARIISDWRASLNVDMLNCLKVFSVTGLDPKDFNASCSFVMAQWSKGKKARI